MLEKPLIGWTHVWVGDMFLGPASYIADVPVDCLDAFLNYFSINNKLGISFNLTFDAESYSFGLVQFDDCLYAIYIKNVPIKLEQIDPTSLGLDKYCSSEEVILTLAKELVSDIRKYLSDWIQWDLCGDETDDDILKRKALLEERCQRLELLLENKKC